VRDDISDFHLFLIYYALLSLKGSGAADDLGEFGSDGSLPCTVVRKA
jgi:hypothetical protein